MFQVLVPNFFMDIYVNGVNQLFDLEIDKVSNLLLEIIKLLFLISLGLLYCSIIKYDNSGIFLWFMFS